MMDRGHIQVKEMIALIREGEREGFNLLYANCAAPLYGVIYRIAGDKAAAENLLEVTFVDIFRRIDEYKELTTFFTWMIQIAQAVSVHHIKSCERPKCKDEVEMIFFGGYSYDEAAKENNVTAGVVRNNVRSKLKSFRQSL